MNNIKFDGSLFSTHDLKSTLHSHGKVGFYKVENDYIFSHTSLTKQTLVTDIGKIASVLQQHSFSTNELQNYDLKKTRRALTFFGKINSVIEKRNVKLQQIRENKIIKCLLAIPLINRIVKWCLQNIELTFLASKVLVLNAAKKVFHVAEIALSPKIREVIMSLNSSTSFNDEMKFLGGLEKISKLKNLQFDLIEKYLDESTFELLQNQRNKLLDLLAGVRQNYKASYVDEKKQWDEAEIWGLVEIRIHDAYKKRISQINDTLQKAENISKLIKENPEKLIAETFNLTASSTLLEGYQAYLKLKKKLTLDPHFPLDLINQIEKVESLAKKVYCEWVVEKAKTADILDEFSTSFSKEESFTKITEIKNDYLNLLGNITTVLEEAKFSKDEMAPLKAKILEDYERQLSRVIPSIKNAQHILDADHENEPILPFTLNTSINFAEDSFKRIIDLLNFNSSDLAHYPAKLQEIITNASKLVQKAYNEWLHSKAVSLTQEIIFEQFSGQSYEEAVKLRDMYLKWVKKAISLQSEESKLKDFQDLKIRIDDGFLIKASETSPSLQEVGRIIDVSNEDSDSKWESILNLKGEYTMKQAFLACEKEIVIPKNYPETFMSEIIVAKNIKKRAYAEILAKHVYKLCMDPKPNLSLIFETSDSKLYLKRYEKVMELFVDYNEESLSIKESFCKLNSAFGNRYIVAQIPFGKSRESRRALDSIFHGLNEYSKISKAYDSYKGLLGEIGKFNEFNADFNSEIDSSLLPPIPSLPVENMLIILMKQMKKELEKVYPSYKKAKEICSADFVFKQTEEFFQMELKLLETLDLQKVGFSKEIITEFKTAKKRLKEERATFISKLLNERKENRIKEKQNPGPLAKMKNAMNSSTDKAKNFMKLYEEELKGLLGLEKEVAAETIHTKYKELCVFEGTSIMMPECLVQAYEHYTRALKLEPIYLKAFDLSYGNLDTLSYSYSDDEIANLIKKEIQVQQQRKDGKVKYKIMEILIKIKIGNLHKGKGLGAEALKSIVFMEIPKLYEDI